LTNLEKNELQSMSKLNWQLCDISPKLIICYAGCHFQLIAVDLSTLWLESAVNRALLVNETAD